MKSKTTIQITLIIFALIISSYVYLKFFSVDILKNDVEINEKIIQNSEDSENQNELKTAESIIDNLEYKSQDAIGNRYLIKSKKAESSTDNQFTLKLIDVDATIFLVGKPPIIINSNYAIHNKQTFNTEFFGNVKILHEDIDVKSDNLDLLYDINLVSLYNIKEAYFNNTELIADKINFDMLTRDISINMNEEKDKIAIFYK
tara:strand:+ start:943 stop:1548 length:606 start_codon:yes stop_codon:yes gene_type:complete